MDKGFGYYGIYVWGEVQIYVRFLGIAIESSGSFWERALGLFMVIDLPISVF